MKLSTAGFALVGAFIIYVVYKNLSSGNKPATTQATTLPVFTQNSSGASNIGIPVQVKIVSTIPGFLSDIPVYEVYADGMTVGGLVPNSRTPNGNFNAYLDTGYTVRLGDGTNVGTLAQVAPDQVQSGSDAVPVASGGTPQPEAANSAIDTSAYTPATTDPANNAGPFPDAPVDTISSPDYSTPLGI